MDGAFRLSVSAPAGQVELAPVYNMLNSLALLHHVERMPGVGGWVHQTAAALTPQQLATNRLIFEQLSAALLPDQLLPDFPSYLDALATQHPQALRDRLAAQPPVSAEAQALLSDPFQLHDLLVTHLRELWESFGASEWARVQRKLQQNVETLRRSSPGSGVSPEVVARNLQTFVAGAVGYAPGVQALVFVPSAHTGSYTTQLQRGTTLYVFFDVELNLGVLLRGSPMKQAELVGRLGALTEPARLRVLTLLAQHGELTLQDLMALLATSQPNVSRYLKSLGSYVSEQRGRDGRKRYRLIPLELDVTFQSLKQAVFAAPATPDTQMEQPMQTQGLARYLDAQGAVQLWPRQDDDRRSVLGYLAEHLAADTTYSEKEINALLTQYVLPHVRDHVTVRRDLIDERLLQRSGDGTRYWRSAETAGPTSRTLSDEEAYDQYWGGDLPQPNA